MFKKFLQSALITFLLHLMVNSEPNEFKTAVNWNKLDVLVFNLK
jgi:hypothetical protein